MGARLLYGHKYMDYGSYVPWGLWVAFDLFFLGLTAGAYIITVLTYGFRIKLFAALGPLSVFALLVTLMCEGHHHLPGPGPPFKGLPVFDHPQLRLHDVLAGGLHRGHVGHLPADFFTCCYGSN